ncbi:MAG: HigA family addiction module antidote protein [Odoribacteraceae bacterium]|jgi:addiction module HigA family antidote|nr:HigA family addiction module antidote protein [Odoribacteraceae bacterium]
MNDYICARPIHPGEVLKDEIEYRGISQRELATRMGVSYKMLNNILNGHRPVTDAMALMFEAALDVPACSLINIQSEYTLRAITQDKALAARLAKIRATVAAL